MQNLLRFGGLAAAELAFATFASGAVAQENTTHWACQDVGNSPAEPLGDREGHSISVGQYSCRAESGPWDGSVGGGTVMWEWNGPKATMLAEHGITRKPGATLAWQGSEGELTLTMADGKVTGWTASGRGKNLLATGDWASKAGTMYHWTAKSVGPSSQFTIDATNE